VLGKDRDEVPAQRENSAGDEEQSRLLEEADLVLFVLGRARRADGHYRDIAELLASSRNPGAGGCEQADGGTRGVASEFYELGIGEPWVISALHGTGSGDLLDAVGGGTAAAKAGGGR